MVSNLKRAVVVFFVCVLVVAVLTHFLVYSKLGLPMTPRRETGDVVDSDKCSTLDVYHSVSHVTVMRPACDCHVICIE